MRAIPLRLRGQATGALNLFHHTPGSLPEPDLALAQALADVATIGILSERAIRRGEVLNEQLQTALHSRVIIEQVKGVLAQCLVVDMDVAFDLLRRHARTNTCAWSMWRARSSPVVSTRTSSRRNGRGPRPVAARATAAKSVRQLIVSGVGGWWGGLAIGGSCGLG